MQQYLARRVLLFVPTLLLASLIIFTIMRAIPGDVVSVILSGFEEGSVYNAEQAERYRTELGLNDPLPVQYGRWLWSMVNGEFGGRSIVDREELSSIIARRFPVTLQLTFLTAVIAVGVSLPLGVAAALYQNRWPDYVVRVVTIAGLSLPNFWVALVLILAMVLVFSWAPPLFYVNVWEDPQHYILKAIWPALVLAWGFSSYMARVTRSSMLEVLRQDYVRTAWSKGLKQQVIIGRHALRNALIPVVTLSGLQLAGLLSGTIILESIFSIPGIGQGLVDAATSRDYPVIQSLAMLIVFLILGLNLIVDVIYALIDPRISYSH